ncbi:unnamed protein product [Cunninghamella blakesleeana]
MKMKVIHLLYHLIVFYILYSGKPGFSFSEAMKHPDENWNVILWIASSFFILITTIVCFTIIAKHVRNYNQPIIQQHKLRILIYPPFYALLTWIAYLQMDYATVILFFASFFEAFAVFNLYTCLFDYLQPLRDQMKDKKVPVDIKVLGCFHLRVKSKWGMHFRVIIGILVIQFPVWTIFNAIISLIAQSQGYYCESAPSIHGAHVYLMVIEFISLFTILTSLIIYMRVFSDELRQENVPYMGMFWTIKFPIFIVFFVSTAVLSMLEFKNIIQPIYSKIDGSILWTPIQIKTSIKTSICCFAMFIASMMMMNYYQVDEYRPKVNDNMNNDSTIDQRDDKKDTMNQITTNQMENQVEVIPLKKMSPCYAIIDAYFFYIPRFLYQIYQYGIDTGHLFRKRKEIRRKRIFNRKNKKNSTTTTTTATTTTIEIIAEVSETIIPSSSSSSSSSPSKIINDHDKNDLNSLTDIHPVKKSNPSSSTS